MAILDGYLTSISDFLRTKDTAQLKQFLRVEPPVPEDFYQLGRELKTSWRDNKKLEKHIDNLVLQSADDTSDDGGAWPGFLNFMREYLIYWRDVNFEDLVDTHQRLSDLAGACITALSHSKHGILILPATEQVCGTLARLAVMLDKRPDLTSKLRKVTEGDGETVKTLVEMTAESMQRAFTVCLTERTRNSNGIGRDGRPEGKKVGIYSFANMVLRLLFQCRKTTLASQIFTNISSNSPPLGLYPSAQRVSFLYFLGRYHFSNNHFFFAQACLQSAYDQCHAQCIKQRRLILIYLMSCNMILGRFPTKAFLHRQEAAGLLDKFVPISIAIRKGGGGGDMISFKKALGKEGGNEQWFFRNGVLLQLLSRCEVLVWRSFARRVFLLTYQFPTDPTSRKAPTLDLLDLVAAAQYCQKILEGWQRPVDSMTAMQSGRTHPNSMFMKSPDLVPPQGRKILGPYQGMIYGNKMPDLHEIEAIVASLAKQDLLHGFLSHNQSKFAIIGSKQRGGPLIAGFPGVWEVLKAKAEREGRDEEVPGWVQTAKKGVTGGVVNLTGIARAVGSAG